MIHQQDYTAYQTYALLDFNISFEKDVPADDISRIVIEVTERIDINKFVDFTHRNSHGYDGLMMLRLLLLAFADNGYASTRKLAELTSDICSSHRIRSLLIRHFRDSSMMILLCLLKIYSTK